MKSSARWTATAITLALGLTAAVVAPVAADELADGGGQSDEAPADVAGGAGEGGRENRNGHGHAYGWTERPADGGGLARGHAKNGGPGAAHHDGLPDAADPDADGAPGNGHRNGNGEGNGTGQGNGNGEGDGTGQGNGNGHGDGNGGDAATDPNHSHGNGKAPGHTHGTEHGVGHLHAEDAGDPATADLDDTDLDDTDLDDTDGSTTAP